MIEAEHVNIDSKIRRDMRAEPPGALGVSVGERGKYCRHCSSHTEHPVME